MASKAPTGALRIRSATTDDGAAICSMVARCGALDENSAYAYVMFADEFGESCVVAEDTDGRLVGFVTGFVRPRDPSSLFLWQVGVDPDHRGRGLAHALVRSFVDQASTPMTRRLETTIGTGNEPSRALFESYARSRGSALRPIGSYPGWLLGMGHPDEVRYAIDFPIVKVIR